MHITCKYCNKEFHSNRNRKFCSMNCYIEFKRVISYCETCGELIKKHISKLRFCSRKCSQQQRKRSQTSICTECKKEFNFIPWQRRNSKNHYCSTTCKYKSKKVEVDCGACGAKFKIHKSRQSYYNTYYCNNKCHHKATINDFRITDKIIEENQYQKFVRELRHTAKYLLWKKACLVRDQFCCTKCSNLKQLTVHHKIGMFDICKRLNFDKDLILQDLVFNNIDNGITLCRSCHFKEHLKGKENEI